MSKDTFDTRDDYARGYDDGWDAREKQKPIKLVDAIQFRQEQYGWNDSKMAAMLDLSRPHYSEFKSGKRGLPIASVRKAYAIGIPASVLLDEATDFLPGRGVRPNTQPKRKLGKS